MYNFSISKIKLSVLLAIFISLFINITFSSVSSAAILGRNYGYGYFTGKYETGVGCDPNQVDCASNVLPSINGDLAIPYSINSANSFIQFLKDSYNSGDKHRATGSAFIVNTMLGNNAPGTGRTISSATWNRLSSLIFAYEQNNNINWNVNVTSCKSSYYQINNDDDAFYTYSDPCPSQPGIIFSFNDGSGKEYQLSRICGNPRGDMPAPIISEWSISVTTTVDKTSANVGDTITWKHRVTNSGLNPTTKLVSSFAKNSSASSSFDTPTVGADLSQGSIMGDYKEYTSTYTVKSNDAGKTLCRLTGATPKSDIDSGTVESLESCVNIGQPSVATGCRPISIVANPITYRSGTSSHHPSSVITTVPIDVSTSVWSYANNPVTKKTIITDSSYPSVDRITKPHITGDIYTVYFIETQKHISGFKDNYKTTCSKKGGCVTKYTGTTTLYSGPSSWTSSIGPCYDYNISTNAVNTNHDDMTEVGTFLNLSFPVSMKIAHKYTTKTKQTDWQITRIIIAPGSSIPIMAAKETQDDPCKYYGSKVNGSSTCGSRQSSSKKVVNSLNVEKTGTTVFNSTGKVISGSDVSYDYVVEDWPAGTKICYAFSVRASSSDPNNMSTSAQSGDKWYHSSVNPAISCSIVEKKPKVQVWGGDLIVKNGNVSTSTSRKNNSIFGSWAEYALIASGSVNGMASGAAYNSLSGLLVGGNCNTLTFTNSGNSVCDSGSLGRYVSTKSSPDVSSSFPVNSGTPKLSGAIYLSNISSGLYTTSGDITIIGGEIPAGKWIVINTTSKVTITGNINYDSGSIKDISKIPQVVIIAGNIDIIASVGKVDSWLISNNGSINTCSDFSGKLTVSKCGSPLIINGPVIASRLYLNRTAGSGVGAASGDPAEIINLRPDAYLWVYSRASSNGHIQTVYFNELPPRL